MNRVLSVKNAAEGREELKYNCASAAAVFDGLTGASVQPAAEHGFLCKEPKKFKLKRRSSSNCTDQFPSLEIVSGIPKVCVGKRREAQGRAGETSDMNSAPPQADSNTDANDANAPPYAKGKDGKKGKNQSKGVKREKDCTRTRKDKAGDEFGPVSENGCAFGGTENLIGRGGMDAAIVEQTDDTSTEEHCVKTLSIKTRSVGTNTHEAEKAIESNYMEPCRPGTSVNLEGFVWHETEEGVLVVNVTWRKRTYVGTLLDCTKHDWAPPRFCESPMSDSDMPCARGRGKRMRLTIPEQQAGDPSLSKIRGLTHKRRGVGIGNKGRRGSLNLSVCRTPGYYAVDDIKSNPLICAKRKGKAPADLDLSLVSEDIRNGNGKRIRAKSRSAPSTPQGKSDPVFLDQVCASPMLIDCPHPNCNKKYKHINGLRYHQSHAHLNSDSKQDFEVESEDRLSDFDDPLSTVPYDSSENIISKKPKTMYKLNSVTSPKSRKTLLNNDNGPIANAKLRRNVASQEGSIDDLSNLPLISNMSVVLENCLITDRNTSVEMPKLEAEGVIDKRDICNKSKKESGFTERCSAKSRTNRLITAAVAPPKLTAIPPAGFPAKVTEVASHQVSPTVALTKAKNISLKPIKPKPDAIAQVNVANNVTAVPSKDGKRKEKHRLKDRNCKDPRSPKSDLMYTKTDEAKSIGKDFPVSLLKEHLSKQDIVNCPSDAQESRMASIRAEADKVYTFSDNAPSPSIGSSARIDCGPLTNGDGATAKTNSPAYSDISDAAEDGGPNSRSRRNSTQDSNPNSNINPKMTGVTGIAVKEVQSASHGHGYEAHCMPGYVHSGQANSTSFLKAASPYGRTKDDLRDLGEDTKSSESSTHSSSHSQLQYSVTETHTALAQSLYYGQYSRGVSMDQKVLMMPGTHRQHSESSCDELQYNKQSRSQARRGSEQKERMKDDQKQFMSSPQSIHKGTNSAVKINCAKPGFIYVELDKQLSFSQQQGKAAHLSVTKEQGVNKESEDLSMESSNSKSNVDTNVTFLNASESQSWSHSYQSKYVKQQNQEVNKISEDTSLSPDKGKDWHLPLEPESRLEAELQSVKGETAAEVIEDGTRGDAGETLIEMSEDLQSGRGAASPPQQSFIQYQRSYPYLHLCETGSNAYSVMSPALVHNYPGFHYPLYGKTAGREDSDGVQSNKPVTDSPALELLSHPLLPYHGKSPVPGERGSPDQERDTERERESVPFGRHIQTHHLAHLGMSYTLVSGQYDPFQGEKVKNN
nr:zinc finger protein 608 [Misgurnus anguillicaudatus]